MNRPLGSWDGPLGLSEGVVTGLAAILGQARCSRTSERVLVKARAATIALSYQISYLHLDSLRLGMSASDPVQSRAWLARLEGSVSEG